MERYHWAWKPHIYFTLHFRGMALSSFLPRFKWAGRNRNFFLEIGRKPDIGGVDGGGGTLDGMDGSFYFANYLTDHS